LYNRGDILGIFSKINFGLSKTRNKMSGAIDDMLDSFDSFEDDLYTELEEILVMSDVGVETAVQVVEELKKRVASEKIKKTSEVKKELQSIIADMLYGGEDMGLITLPSIIMVLGVNGAGKTTSIGKMAAMYKAQGKKVILGAADTFRAAAIDQLDVWAKRADVDIIKHKEGADPAAVVYDTIQAGVARDCDIIICDTAGRLHNKKNLMDELNKIYRVVDKELPYADREILLVLDATTGQNGVNQAREFMKIAELTGIILTKLDGTARGGVVLTIKNELKLPVKFIGVGEGIDDLQPFNPSAFAASLFESVQERGDDNEDSLKDLVNSDDYKNYTPSEDDDSGVEAVQAFLEGAFGITDEQGENVPAYKLPSRQENGNAAEEAEKESAKSTEETAEAESQSQSQSEEAEAQGEEAVGQDSGVNEETTAEEPVAEEPVAEEPVVEESVAEEPVAEEPVVEESVAEEPVVEEPVIEEAVAEETVVEATVPEEPKHEEPKTEETPKVDISQLFPEVDEEPTPAPAPAKPAEPEKKKRRGLFGLFGRNS
jgi:fused signal recognition particle receptor